MPEILRDNQQLSLDIDNLNRTNILNGNVHTIHVIKSSTDRIFEVIQVPKYHDTTSRRPDLKGCVLERWVWLGFKII